MAQHYPPRYGGNVNKQIWQYLGKILPVQTGRNDRLTLEFALLRGFCTVKALKDHTYGLIKSYAQDLWLDVLQRGEFEETPGRIAIDPQHRSRMQEEAARPRNKERWTKRVEVLVRGQVARPVSATVTAKLKIVYHKNGRQYTYTEEHQKVVQGQLSQLWRMAKDAAEEMRFVAEQASPVHSVELPMIIVGVPDSYVDRGRGTCVYDALRYVYVNPHPESRLSLLQGRHQVLIHPARHTRRPPLCYRVMGNHMYLHLVQVRVAVKDEEGLEHMRRFVERTGQVPDGRFIHMFDNNVVSYQDEEHGWAWHGDTWSGVLWRLVKKVFGDNGMARGRPNPDARAVLMTAGVKAHAQDGFLDVTLPVAMQAEELKHGSPLVLDISKCHAAGMYEPAEEWGLPSLHDHVKHFQRPVRCYKPSKLGLYHVDSPHVTTLFRRGTGWYIRALAPLNLFVEVAAGDFEVLKELFNQLSGYQGKDALKRTICFVDKSLEVYWRHLMELNTTICLAILDNQSMRVLDMEEAHDGVPTIRKSDTTVLLNPERRSAPQSKGICVPSPAGRDHAHITDSNQWEAIVELLLTDGRCLVMGPPGVGKTYGALQVAAKMRRKGCRVLDMAFTNTGAINIGGVTVSLLPAHYSWIIDAFLTFKPDAKVLLVGDPNQRPPVEVGAASSEGCRVLDMAFTNTGAINIGGVTVDRGMGLKRKEADPKEEPGEPTHYSKAWVKQLAANVDMLLLDEVSLLPAHYSWIIDAFLTFKPDAKVLLLTVRHRSKDQLLHAVLDALKDDAMCTMPGSEFQRGICIRNLCWTRACRDRVNAMLNLHHKPAEHLPEAPDVPEMFIHTGLPMTSIQTLRSATPSSWRCR
ncbi:hypothetical protein COO60DRAFT_1458210 [Scenedesmus sp. NREL 46B-D3]|nr:hypothetical protein COO60DRAFT_1458210 [Scenedesmus sp. NREL 46B-D3]